MDVWSQFLLRSETGLIFALILTFALYFLFRKTGELSRHAAQNTAATLVICGANYAVALMFLDELNVGAQRAYDILAIPKIACRRLGRRSVVARLSHRYRRTRFCGLLEPSFNAHQVGLANPRRASFGYACERLYGLSRTCPRGRGHGVELHIDADVASDAGSNPICHGFFRRFTTNTSIWICRSITGP